MRRIRRRGPADWVVGVLAVVIVVVGTFFAFSKELPFRSHFEVRAALVDAQGVKAGTQVRVAGVTVGEVRSVRSRGSGAALVTLRLQRRGLPLHRDVRIKVRPRLFFEGNPFLDVTPGSPSAPVLRDGDTIPVAQTAHSVDFDELLSVLDRSSRQDLSTLLREYGRAVKGSGRAVNRTIPLTEPAYRDGAIVASAQQGERPGQLAAYLRGAARFNEALDRDPASLQSLLRDLRVAAGAFADEDAKLEETLAELPPLLRRGTPALRDLEAAFPPLRRLVADLREASRTAPPALDAQLALARQLRGLVRPAELRGLAADVRRSAPAVAELNRAGVPLGEQSRRLSSCQANNLAPVSRMTVPDRAIPAPGRVFEETSWVLTGLAGESRSHDANGQWVRIYLTTGNEAYSLGDGRILLNDRPIQGTNPPPPKRLSPLRPDVPCETQELPDLRTRPGGPPERIPLQPPPAARLEQARRVTTAWIRDELKAMGLEDRLRVRDELLSRAELRRLTR